MPEFSMQKTELEGLLKLISLSGIVTDCALKTRRGRISSRGLCKQTSVFFSVSRKCKTTEEGTIEVPDIERFLELLSRFAGTVKVSVSKEGTLLIRGHDKRLFLRGVATGELDSTRSLVKVSKIVDMKNKKFKDIKFGSNYFTLTKEISDSIVRDIIILNTGEYICRVELAPGNDYVRFVLIDRDTNNKFSVKAAVPEIQAKSKISLDFGYGLKEVLETTQGDVKIFLSKMASSPAWITSDDGFFIVQSESEDEDEE